MKLILLSVCLQALTTFTLGQSPNTWIGGDPTAPGDWNCAANWSTHRVPDAHSRVIIPSNTTHSPEISTADCEAGEIVIAPSAMLTIGHEGSLAILYPDYCDDVSRIKVFGNLTLGRDPGPDMAVVSKSLEVRVRQ